MATQSTDGFVLNQTMLRIKDPSRSIPFYEEVLGMTSSIDSIFQKWRSRSIFSVTQLARFLRPQGASEVAV